MEKEYNMTINRLPAKTWNWLRMNETQLEKIEVPTAGGVKVSLPEKIRDPSPGMRILQASHPAWERTWTVF